MENARNGHHLQVAVVETRGLEGLCVAFRGVFVGDEGAIIDRAPVVRVGVEGAIIDRDPVVAACVWLLMMDGQPLYSFYIVPLWRVRRARAGWAARARVRRRRRGS